MKETYLQYGISLDVANKLESLGLPKTTFERTSQKNLVDKYGLSKEEVKKIKTLIKREPIDEDTVQHLLENSNFTCCICKGTKSDSYIIHHIEHYSKSQDNSYGNLAVLCPNDHELAHKEGTGLTLKITADQIRKTKIKWEKEVISNNARKAAVNADIHEVDFLNIPRLLETYKGFFKTFPKTEYTEELIEKRLIDKKGFLDTQGIADIANNPHTPFIFFGPKGSWLLREHFFEIFKKILTAIEFIDLDDLLNKKAIKENIIGKYCFYVGGLYSKKVSRNVQDDSTPVKFYFKKKGFQVEWLVDPKYICSNSAFVRTNQRNTYLIYGKIMNSNIEEINNKKIIVVDIRPYCYGLPTASKHKKPDIAYIKEYESVLDDIDEDDDVF